MSESMFFKLDQCPHGNPKGSCPLCAEKKEIEAEISRLAEKEKEKIRQPAEENKEETKGKIDYSNPEHLREILSNPNKEIDLTACGIQEFLKTTFGINSKFKERTGITLLRNFGSAKYNTENMIG